ncbi:response regulator transcription factor, partial [Kaistella sp.]|uniref:response regulator transcription factor n=1 Tax=Kaistella sp. TaxID=2782235 RepID=UPI003C4B390C
AKCALLNFICNIEEEGEKKYNSSEELTAREKDVLLLICDGLRSKEIAGKLFISTHTVESHRRNMMLKLNINNSSKLVKFAMENRLIEY